MAGTQGSGHAAVTRFANGDLIFERGFPGGLRACLNFATGVFHEAGTVQIVGGTGKYLGTTGELTIDAAAVMLPAGRTPPQDQLALVKKHLDAGKPLVGIRTASHAFSLRNNAQPPENHAAWLDFDRDVLGTSGVGEWKGEFVVVTGVPTLYENKYTKKKQLQIQIDRASQITLSPVPGLSAPTATAALGRTLTAAGLLGSTLKDGQTVMVRVLGDGPLGGALLTEDFPLAVPLDLVFDQAKVFAEGGAANVETLTVHTMRSTWEPR